MERAIGSLPLIYKRDGQIFAGYLQDNHPHLYNQGSWLFGDWDKALREAGFEPEKMRMTRFWDQQRVIREIHGLRKKNLPLYAKYVMKHHPKLFSAARRQCGSWGKGLLAAGISTPTYAHGPRGCIGFLQTLRDALGSSENDLPQALKACAVYYFGSLQKAVSATKSTGVGVSTKTKMKIVLSRMHKSKQSLIYVDVRRDHPALVRAAEKHFGSGGKALYAAGIDPDLHYVHHQWRGPTEPQEKMATYLARVCPQCNGYLGIVLREPGRNTPLQAINGHCLDCGYHLAWILVRGKKKTR